MQGRNITPPGRTVGMCCSLIFAAALMGCGGGRDGLGSDSAIGLATETPSAAAAVVLPDPVNCMTAADAAVLASRGGLGSGPVTASGEPSPGDMVPLQQPTASVRLC
jgi:hypothetical protein